jgi:hypothetical protein
MKPTSAFKDVVMNKMAVIGYRKALVKCMELCFAQLR